LPNSPFSELSRLLQGLQHRTAATYAAQINKRGFIDPNDDVRITTFGKLCAAAVNAQLGMALVAQYLQYEGWWSANCPGLVGTGRQQTLENFVDMLRISLVLSAFSAVESSLRVILKELDPTAANGSTGEFKSVYECLLKSKLSRKYESECELLDLLRLVRNTVHNNGVYLPKSGNTETINWKSVTYNFVPGRAVTMVDWPFVIDRMDELVSLCETLVSDPVIGSVMSMMKDPAVTQVHRVHMIDISGIR